MPMAGVRCPTCAIKGQEVWVIPGKACGYCGTACSKFNPGSNPYPPHNMTFNDESRSPTSAGHTQRVGNTFSIDLRRIGFAIDQQLYRMLGFSFTSKSTR